MNTLPSGLPSHVDDSEKLARFLTSSSHFNASGVKPCAFLPNPNDGKTSVFRHDVIPALRLWQIGDSVVQTTGKTVHGTAFLCAADVREIGLDVLSQEPPDRHADIDGWPRENSDPAFEKAARKEISLLLAERATTLMRP